MSNFEPIVLTKYGETLEVTNFRTEDAKIPFDCSDTYIGVLEFTPSYVYATKVSNSHWILFSREFGRIGEPIPLKVDTFGKLREWCKEQIAMKREWEEKLAALWGIAPFVLKQKVMDKLLRARQIAMVIGNDNCGADDEVLEFPDGLGDEL